MATQPILVTSRANARVKQLRAAFTGNARLSGGLVAIEGENLLREALASGLPLKSIFLSERVEPLAWLPRGVELLVLADEVFASAVATQHPQGIAALLVPPVWTIESAFPANPPQNTAPLLLVAAGLQDPGNLGTLIRSAEAFGATAVLTTPGTVSEWNQKSLRASAGSVFRIPVVHVGAEQLIALKSRGVRLLAAVAPNSAVSFYSPLDCKSECKATRNGHAVLSVIGTDLACACALMIGNEGAGLSAELLSLADARIAIPTPGRVESLNAAVAGSLLLYEASRQRTSDLEPRTSTLHA
jgi:TrmH family RNA methyltransferase